MGKQKRKGKSPLRKLNNWLHLWLGIGSGLIVLIVSLTGCIYVFEREVRNVTEPWQFVTPEQKPFLLPSGLKAIAAKTAFGNTADSSLQQILGVSYGAVNKAALAAYMHKKYGYTVIYINPYSGKVLHTKAFNRDFFRIILMGHYYLWLPPKIGQPVVAYGVLVFVLLLITGMVMWWPKNLKKANVDKSFKISWRGRFKRLNYDLHNVLGFYALLAAFAIAVTGLVWGFQWFSKSYYRVISGGRPLPEFKQPVSDTLRKNIAVISPEDKIWLNVALKMYNPGKGSIQIQSPVKPSDPIRVFYNPEDDSYYKRAFYYFDRYTLQELKGGGVYGEKYENAAAADKLYRMNYDIHVGAIGGLPGKIIAFIVSFICASLPVTGFIIWWGKKKKKKGTGRHRSGSKKLSGSASAVNPMLN